MKATQINSYGDSSVIEIYSDAPNPEIKENQVLVEVYAAALNPIDYKVREGYLKDAIKALPITLGTDFSGKIVEIGSAVTDYKIGDEVYGNAIVLGGGSGTLAEFTAANTKNIYFKPKTLNFVESAALPLAAASAIQAIEEHINLKKGQKMLIQGGGGGIGSLAIQIAKMHGAYIAATASPETLEFVKSLGADEVIDYTSQNFEDIVHDYDAVFDTVGGETAQKSLHVLKKGGVAVSMAGQFDESEAEKLEVMALTQNTKTETPKLERIAQLVDTGKLKAEVDKVFSLDEIKEAFNYLEKEHPKGKVVVEIK